MISESKKALQALIIRPFAYTHTLRTRHYQVLPLLVLLAVVACCAYAVVVVVVHMPLPQALVAVPTLGAVVAGCAWCAWAFVETDAAEEEEEIEAISAPTVGLREVVVVLQGV